MKNDKYKSKLRIPGALVLTILLSFLCACSNVNESMEPAQSQQSSKSPEKKRSKDIFLRINSGGHTALIRDVIPIPEQDLLISASDDKSIKIWELTSGKVVRNILGQIDSNYGEIYAIALSPDHKFLVSSVRAYPPCIRIHTFDDGNIIRRLTDGFRTFHTLTFSSDGKFLIAAADNHRIYFWDVENNFSLIHKSFVPDSRVMRIQMDFDQNQYRLVCIETEKVNMIPYQYDTTTKQLTEQKPKMHSSNGTIRSASISKSRIAYSTNHNITILEMNLEPVISKKTKKNNDLLSLSPNGEYLVSTEYKTFTCDAYKIKNASMDHLSTFKKHNNTVSAITFLDDQIAITAGGESKEIFIWDIHQKERIESKLSGAGRTVYATGLNDSHIFWGNEFGQPPVYKLNFKDCVATMVNYHSDTIHTKLATTYSSGGMTYSLKSSETKEKLSIFDGNSIEVATIVRNQFNGTVHNFYGFTNKGIVISGGANGQLVAYSLDGTERVKFIGHTGEIMALTIYQDRMVSAGSDQMIKLWDISDIHSSTGDKPSKELPELSIFSTEKQDWIAWIPEGYFTVGKIGDGSSVSHGSSRLDPSLFDYVGYQYNKGQAHAAYYYTFDQLWKIFYDTERVINCLNSKTPIQLPYDVEDLIEKQLNPPEIQLPFHFDLFSSSVIIYEKTTFDLSYTLLSKANIDQIVYKNNNTLIAPGRENRQQYAPGKYIVNDTLDLSYGINTIQIAAQNVNNIVSKEKQLNIFVPKKSIKRNIPTKTFPYRNEKLRIYVPEKYASRKVSSKKKKYGFNNQSKDMDWNDLFSEVSDEKEQKQYSLYVLAIGISEYQDNDISNLKYADDDAEDFLEMMSKRAKPLFKEVKSTLLINNNATTMNIKDTVTEIAGTCKKEDRFVFFLAGHGKLVEDEKQMNNAQYHFFSHDAIIDNETEKISNSIIHVELQYMIKAIPASQKIIFLDTCDSASALKKQTFIERFGYSTGYAFIASAEKEALEGVSEKDQNSIFTSALLKGIKGDAATVDKGKIMIFDLAQYLRKEVPEIAMGRFGKMQAPSCLLYNDNIPLCCSKGYDRLGCKN